MISLIALNAALRRQKGIQRLGKKNKKTACQLNANPAAIYHSVKVLYF
jgi:hypothetical protein